MPGSNAEISGRVVGSDFERGKTKSISLDDIKIPGINNNDLVESNGGILLPGSAVKGSPQIESASSAAIESSESSSLPKTMTPGNMSTFTSILGPSEIAVRAKESNAPKNVRDQIGAAASESGYKTSKPQQSTAEQNYSLDISVPSFPGGPVNVRTQEKESKAVEKAEERFDQADEAVAKHVTEQAQRESAPQPNGRQKRVYDAPTPKPVTSGHQMRKGFSKFASDLRDMAKKSFGRKYYKGTSLYAKMISRYKELAMDEVGIGINDLYEMLKSSPYILTRLEKELIALGEVESGWGNELYSQYQNNLKGLAELLANQYINRDDIRIWVETYKSPVNREESAQKRVLRIVSKSGISLNPIMANQYNADFDGDDMNLSIEDKNWDTVINPMQRLKNLEGDITIPEKFFPQFKFSSEENRDASIKQMQNYLDSENNSGISEKNIKKLAELLVDYSNGKKDLKDLANLIYEIAMITDGTNDQRYKLMSDLLTASYRGCVKASVMETYLKTSAEDIISIEDLPGEINYDDAILIDVAQDMVVGLAPNNWYEMYGWFCRHMGMIENENVHFRFTADVAKKFKFEGGRREGDIYIVETKEAAEDVMKKTMEYAMSKVISNAEYSGEHARISGEFIKNTIIMEVGLPRKGETWQSFMGRFSTVYQKYSSLINQANIKVMSDMGRRWTDDVTPSISRNGKVGELLRPFYNIYQDFTIEQLFGQYMFFGNAENTRGLKEIWSTLIDNKYEIHGLATRYRNMTLREFKNKNTIRNHSDIKSKGNKLLQTHEVGEKNISEENSFVYFIMGIADMKTSTASKWNKEIYGECTSLKNGKVPNRREKAKLSRCEMMVSLLRDTVDIFKNGGADKMTWMYETLDVLYYMGGNLFNHYGMNSMEKFLTSKYGNELVLAIEHNPNTKDATNAVASIRMTMLIEYRLSKIDVQQQKINDLLERQENGEHINPFELKNAISHRDREVEMLMSSSNVWNGIVRELYTDGTIFDKITASKENKFKNQTLNAVWSENGKTICYWSSPSHNNFEEVLMDTKLPKWKKEAIISDVVKFQTNDFSIDSWSVSYDLEADESNLYSEFTDSIEGVFNASKDAARRFDSFSERNYKAMKKNIDDAYNTYGDQTGTLLASLSILSDHPERLIEIDDGVYADGVLATSVKSYRGSEKNKQHIYVNAIYQALCFQKNGGMNDDVYRTDNRAVGILDAKDVSIIDIVKLLASDEYYLYVYDENGDICRLSRRSFLEIDEDVDVSNEDMEQYIWRFLRDNPRIAAAIRVHHINPLDNNTYMSAKLSTRETMSSLLNSNVSLEQEIKTRIKSELRIHPGYGALIAIANKWHGKNARNMRSVYIDAEDKILNLLINISILKKENPDIDISWFMKEYMHVDMDILTELGKSEYDIDNAFGGMLKDDAEQIYDAMIDYIKSYSDEINDVINELGIEVTLDDVTAPTVNDFTGPDYESCVAFNETRQELTGAKTDISVGVEGSETIKYATWMAILSPEDHYEDLGRYDADDITTNFLGCTATWFDKDGVYHEIEIDEGWADVLGPDIDVVVHLNNEIGNGKAFDKTTSLTNQVSSVAAYFIIKRDSGAEKFNLKVKKSGDDGKDSIIKHSKYLSPKDLINANTYGLESNLGDYEKLSGSVQLTYEQNGIEGARLALANELRIANEICGYTDFDMGNYVCLAELMIAETENGVVIRSLEQIAKAIKYQMPAEILDSGDYGLIESYSKKIADSTGVSGRRVDGVALINRSIKVHKSNPSTRENVSENKRSSSLDRNYQLLVNMLAEFENEGVKAGWKPEEEIGSNESAIKLVGSKSERGKIQKAIARKYKNVQEAINKKIFSGYDVLAYADKNGGTGRLKIGPKSLTIINGLTNIDTINEIINDAYKYGATVLITKDTIDLIIDRGLDVKYFDELIDFPISSDVLKKDPSLAWLKGAKMLPTFDMRLNGMQYSMTDEESRPRFGIFQVSPDRYTHTYEDSMNEFQLGDSMMQMFQSGVDNFSPVWREPMSIKFRDLFPNVFAAYPNASFSVEMADRKVVQQYIIDGDKCTIDYGVAYNNNSQEFINRKEHVDKLIERFKNASIDERGINSTPEHNDIIAWADISISENGQTGHVLAPIIPYERSGKNNVPKTYLVKDVFVDYLGNAGANSIKINIENVSDNIEDETVKFHEGSGAANKLMSILSAPKDGLNRILENGVPLTGCYAAASTSGRRGGINKRIETMNTLMVQARISGYNFAKATDSFPDADENSDSSSAKNAAIVRDALMVGLIGRDVWEEYLDCDIRWHSDPRVNSFVKMSVRQFYANGGNPSDFLCNVWETEEGKTRTNVMWEFRCMFMPSMEYENALLGFIHSMNPGLCPADMNDTDGNYIFKVAHGNGYEEGCLQMRVPHPSPKPDGKAFYTWENVYSGLSFYGQDYSGFFRPNVNGASGYFDATATYALSGIMPTRNNFKKLVKIASADIIRTSPGEFSFVNYDDYDNED